MEAENLVAPRDPRDVPWPHGWHDGAKTRCPDGIPCEREEEWGHPCDRDIGGGYMCDRLPPAEGWEAYDMDGKLSVPKPSN